MRVLSCRGKKLESVVFPQLLFTFTFYQFSQTGWPMTFRNLPFFSSLPALGLQVHTTMPGSLHGLWGPKVRSSCMCACLCTCLVHGYTHTMCARGGQKLTSSIFLNCSPLQFLRQTQSLNLGLTDSAGLGDSQALDPHASASLAPALYMHSNFCMGAEELTSGPPACTLSVLLAEPLPQLIFFFQTQSYTQTF